MGKYKEQLFKTLSRNDTGETGGHQSGISIPKAVAASAIFPKMSQQFLNPRREVNFTDESGVEWTLQYIYYNDKYHGKPAGKYHDEFRLTCTNAYIREHNIKAGDEIWFAIDDNNKRYIGFRKDGVDDNVEIEKEDGVVILKLRSWKLYKQ